MGANQQDAHSANTAEMRDKLVCGQTVNVSLNGPCRVISFDAYTVRVLVFKDQAVIDVPWHWVLSVEQVECGNCGGDGFDDNSLGDCSKCGGTGSVDAPDERSV